MIEKTQTGSPRNDRLLAEFENSLTPTAAMIGAIIGIVVPLSLVTTAIVVLARWSSSAGIALSLFPALGVLSSSIALREIRARVRSGSVQASPDAVGRLVRLQAIQVFLFCSSALVVFGYLYLGR